MTRADPTPRPADDPVRSQADLHRLWTALLHPLGFARTSLWFLVLRPDGVPTGRITEIADWPDEATDDLEPLMQALRPLLDEEPEGSTMAFLRSRPGGAGFTAVDVRAAHGLLRAAGRSGIETWPVHLATDESVVVVPPDALAAHG